MSAIEQLPWSPDAEEAVLGSLVIDPQAVARIAPILRPEDFFRPGHGAIYRAMLALQTDHLPTDIVTLIDRLTRDGTLDDVGGAGFVAQLGVRTPTSLHAEHYARIVRRHAVLRRLVDVAEQIQRIGYSETYTEEAAVQEAERLFAQVREGAIVEEEAWDSLIARLTARALNAEEAADVIPSGFKSIDHIISGVERGELVVIAALSSVGKTSFMTTMAYELAVHHGMGAAIFSAEVGAEQIGNKVLSIHTDIPYESIKLASLEPRQRLRMERAASELAPAHMHIIDASGWTMSAIRTKARQIAQRRPLDFIGIDYLGLLAWEEPKASEHSQMAEAVRGAKHMARELNCVVAALSQFNREGEKSGAPGLHHLYGATAVRNHADMVWILSRPDGYSPDNAPENAVVYATIAKNRNGRIGSCGLSFHGPTMRFRSEGMTNVEPPGWVKTTTAELAGTTGSMEF